MDNKNGTSRKIRAFLIMSLSITAFTLLTTFAKTPESIVTNGLWALSIGGLVCIGGQSLVDVFAHHGKAITLKPDGE